MRVKSLKFEMISKVLTYRYSIVIYLIANFSLTNTLQLDLHKAISKFNKNRKDFSFLKFHFLEKALSAVMMKLMNVIHEIRVYQTT